jgi:hypothetical protein
MDGKEAQMIDRSMNHKPVMSSGAIAIAVVLCIYALFWFAAGIATGLFIHDLVMELVQK